MQILGWVWVKKTSMFLNFPTRDVVATPMQNSKTNPQHVSNTYAKAVKLQDVRTGPNRNPKEKKQNPPAFPPKRVLRPSLALGMVGQHFVPRLGLAPLRDFQGLWSHLVRLPLPFLPNDDWVLVFSANTALFFFFLICFFYSLSRACLVEATETTELYRRKYTVHYSTHVCGVWWYLIVHCIVFI